jgi:hypothetical protein
MAGVLAALVLLAAVVPNVDSGVKGTVTIGPTCPVQRVGDPNCGDKPYRATLKIVRARGGGLVKNFTSRADGRFTVHLATGRYLIERSRGGRLPSLQPVPVKVARHKFTRVAIRFDSGIR